jgi:hypothetical protein
MRRPDPRGAGGGSDTCPLTAQSHLVTLSARTTGSDPQTDCSSRPECLLDGGSLTCSRRQGHTSGRIRGGTCALQP